MNAAGDHATPPRLSREVIVDAYLRVSEAEGTGDISLRRLGSELGVDPTAVYRHFRDKDEILVVASDRLLHEATEDVRPDGCLAVRTSGPSSWPAPGVSRAPERVDGAPTRADGLPHGATIAERCLGFLRQAGLGVPGRSALEALEDYTVGAGVFEAGAGGQPGALAAGVRFASPRRVPQPHGGGAGALSGAGQGVRVRGRPDARRDRGDGTATTGGER